MLVSSSMSISFQLIVLPHVYDRSVYDPSDARMSIVCRRRLPQQFAMQDVSDG